MTTAIKLLDTYKETCKHKTDAETARALGVVPAAVSNWRQGVSHPNAAHIRTMCERTGERTIEWLPRIEADRERNPASKAAWLSALKDAIRTRRSPDCP